MAIEAFFHQNSTYDAVDLRRLITDQWITDGVMAYDDLKGTVVNATDFTINAGRAIVTHDTSGAGRFLVYSSAVETLTLSMPTSAKRRYRIYLLVHDEAVEGGDPDGTTLEVDYTDGADPALPAEPSNALSLYDITVTYQAEGNGLTHASTIVRDLRPRALHVSQGVPVMAIGTRTADLYVPANAGGTGHGGWTAVTLDAADLIDHPNPDADFGSGLTGMHNEGNSPFYIRYSGWWECGFAIRWGAGTDGLTRVVKLVINNTDYFYMTQHAQQITGSRIDQCGSRPLYLDAGDRFTVQVWSSVATTIDSATVWVRLLGTGSSATLA